VAQVEATARRELRDDSSARLQLCRRAQGLFTPRCNWAVNFMGSTLGCSR